MHFGNTQQAADHLSIHEGLQSLVSLRLPNPIGGLTFALVMSLAASSKAAYWSTAIPGAQNVDRLYKDLACVTSGRSATFDWSAH